MRRIDASHTHAPTAQSTACMHMGRCTLVRIFMLAEHMHELSGARGARIHATLWSGQFRACYYRTCLTLVTGYLSSHARSSRVLSWLVEFVCVRLTWGAHALCTRSLVTIAAACWLRRCTYPFGGSEGSDCACICMQVDDVRSRSEGQALRGADGEDHQERVSEDDEGCRRVPTGAKVSVTAHQKGEDAGAILGGVAPNPNNPPPRAADFGRGIGEPPEGVGAACFAAMYASWSA